MLQDRCKKNDDIKRGNRLRGNLPSAT